MACHSPIRLDIVEIENPTKAESGSLSFYESHDGSILLSWIEEQDSLAQLKYANFTDDTFEESKLIAKGYDWFVNWADFPGMAVFSNDTKVAHWLQMSGDGTYDYDVRYSIKEANHQWSNATVLHQDGISAEHGFVSMTAYHDKVLAIWLDGRNTKTEPKTSHDGHVDDHGHGGNPMTLRSALITHDGTVSNRLEMDQSVCDCCQTDLAETSCGLIAVYRDRSLDEIRDIYFSIFDGSQWSESKPVYKDQWKIHGCPVNGPSVAAKGSEIAVAWYTEAEETRSIKLARSSSCDPAFKEPVLIASGDSIMGRIDLIMDKKNNAILIWMAEVQTEANLHLTKVNINGEVIFDQVITQMSKSRRSGFPRLAGVDLEKYIVAYRDHAESKQIKTQIITEI